MKRTYPQQIAKIIREAMDRSGLSSSLAEHRAAAAWIDVVGPAINRYTTKRFVDRGVLHVYITSAPLKNELSFNKARLVEAINAAVGERAIVDVVFH